MATIRNCIFCNRPFGPTRRRSKEHATPQWCRELAPERGPTLHMHTVIRPDGRKDTEQGVRDYFTTVCKDVCEPCNTGWMHELEESASQVVGPLIGGEARRHRYWRQAIGALWAMKTVIVWDSVAPQHRIIPRAVAHHLWATQSLIPMRQQVWIGRYVGDQPQHSFRQVSAAADPAPPDVEPQDAHVHISMVTVGQVAYVVFGQVLPQPLTLTLPKSLETKLLQVWPPQSEVLHWPPPRNLTDADADAALMSINTSGRVLVQPRRRTA